MVIIFKYYKVNIKWNRYVTIVDSINDILKESSIHQDILKENLSFKKELNEETGERIYGELNSGIWWELTEIKLKEKFGSEVYLMPIIIYSDATTVELKGNVQAWPIMISIGNLSNFQRNKTKNKRIIGYIPDIPVK